VSKDVVFLGVCLWSGTSAVALVFKWRIEAVEQGLERLRREASDLHVLRSKVWQLEEEVEELKRRR
jgi:hypothetical protein